MATNHLFKKEKAPLNIGHRLDGKTIKEDAILSSSQSKSSASGDDEIKRGIPFYDYPVGLLRLNRKIEKEEDKPVIIIVLNHYEFNFC